MSWCLNEQTAYFAMQGVFAEFRKRHELLQKHPYRGQNQSTDLCIGLMYNKLGIRDSALVYFNSAAKSSDEVALAAYAQLAMDAKRNGSHDSIFTYYQKSMECWNRLFLQKSQSFTRRLEVEAQTNRMKDAIAEQKLHLMTLLFFVTLFILLAGAGWATSVRLRKRLKTSVKHIENLKREHAVLETKLQSVLEEVQKREKKHERAENEETQIQFDNLCFELRQYASNKQSAPHQLCNELMRQFVEMHHDFVKILKQKYSDIKPTDIFVCILVYSGFGLTEIARVTNHDRQEIRQFMQRISKGLSGTSVGRINDFRDLIASYFA